LLAQTGKSFVASVLAMHQAVYQPGSLVVVCAVAQRQAVEMVRMCRDIYAALGRPVNAASENKLSLELSNGSRILSIPSSEETVRGLSGVRLLVLDEASRIPDAFYGAVMPFLATSNGTLALLSTPLGAGVSSSTRTSIATSGSTAKCAPISAAGLRRRSSQSSAARRASISMPKSGSANSTMPPAARFGPLTLTAPFASIPCGICPNMSRAPATAITHMMKRRTTDGI